MAFDIVAIKETLDLVAIFERDGMTPKRVGSNLFVCCPFHSEETPSCKVDRERFKCFGCGESGDIVDYWKHSRGIQLKQTLEELSELAGLAPLPKGVTPPKPPKRTQKEEKLADPLDHKALMEWADACQKLASSTSQIKRIADWRGFTPEFVKWTAEQSIMGLYRWHGQLRETFLVERPSPEGGMEAVSVHVRLGPNTRGNPSNKNSWRYHPTGAGSWPLLLGDPSKAEFIFMMEGEWDALALVFLHGWHREMPSNVAIFAARGAGAFLRFLPRYQFREDAIVIAFCDADTAGSEWRKKDGLLDTIRKNGHSVAAFEPSADGSDFNDAVKAGLTPEDFQKILQPCLPSALHTKPKGMTFYQWLRENKALGGAVTEVAEIARKDKDRPKSRAGRRLNAWINHWTYELEADHEDINKLIEAWAIYEKEAC